MTNTNIQGPVPIQGRGMVVRPHGDYQPGEFRQLVNAEILDGKIVSRRPIFGNYFDGLVDGTDSFRWQYKGHIGNSAIYYNSGNGKQVAITPNMSGAQPVFDYTAMWPITDIIYANNDVANGGLCYVFNYNNKNYWLICQTSTHVVVGDSTTTATGTEPFGQLFSVFSMDEDAGLNFDAANLLRAGNPYLYGSTTTLRTGFALTYTDNNDPAQALYRNAFMFKDRLWVVINSSIRFSKATNPEDFSVPNGGFFNFPDDNINYAVALRDSIYVFCESKVYSITYTTDPNTDAVVRVLTDQLGGSHATVQGDTVYFVNSQGVFTIVNNTYINKIINSSELGAIEDGRLTSFGKYLIINKYRAQVVPTSDGIGGTYETRYNKFRNGFIKSSTDITKLVDTPSAGVTLSRDDAIGSNPYGVTSSTSGIKAAHDNTANNQISWWTSAGISGARHIDITLGEVYTMGLFLKTNVPANATLNLVFNIKGYTDAGLEVFSYQAYGTLTAAENWKQFSFGTPIINNVAAGTPSYLRIQVVANKTVGGVSNNFVSGENLWSQDYTVEPYKSSTPFRYAYNNLENARIYNVNANTIGAQAVYFYPLPGAGTSGDVVNQYRRHTDTLGLGAQTYFFNTENNSLHAVTLHGRSTVPDTVTTNRDVVEDVASYNVDYDTVYSGPVLIFNSGIISPANSYWTPAMMFENRELIINKYGYKDTAILPGGSNPASYAFVPIIRIEIENFTPDGLDYLVKKFRALELQGILPASNVKFKFAPEDQAYPAGSVISDAVAGSTKPHYGHRIGLMCRGRTLSLYIFVDENTSLGLAAQNWQELELSDMRVLWNYVGRGPAIRSRT